MFALSLGISWVIHQSSTQIPQLTRHQRWPQDQTSIIQAFKHRPSISLVRMIHKLTVRQSGQYIKKLTCQYLWGFGAGYNINRDDELQERRSVLLRRDDRNLSLRLRTPHEAAESGHDRWNSQKISTRPAFRHHRNTPLMQDLDFAEINNYYAT